MSAALELVVEDPNLPHAFVKQVGSDSCAVPGCVRDAYEVLHLDSPFRKDLISDASCPD